MLLQLGLYLLFNGGSKHPEVGGHLVEVKDRLSGWGQGYGAGVATCIELHVPIVSIRAGNRIGEAHGLLLKGSGRYAHHRPGRLLVCHPSDGRRVLRERFAGVCSWLGI